MTDIMADRPKILIVDDKVENLVSLETLLADLDVGFVRARSGNEALKKTLDHTFAIALVDVQMPDMDGFETVQYLRQAQETRNLPVIFISAIYKEDYYQIKGIQTGAVDFIAKPIIPEILIGKVRIFLELYEKQRAMEAEIARRRASEEALRRSEVDLKRANRKLSENFRALTASEERFRSLVLTIPDIVYRIDLDGRFTFLNDAVRRIGYEPDELLGRHFNEILLPSHRDIVSRERVLPEYAGKTTGTDGAPKLFDERRTGERKTTGLELRLAVKGSRDSEPGYLLPITEDHVVVEINSSGLWEVNPMAEDKRFIGTVGVIRDISERKAMETALKESEDRLRLIFENAAAGIVLVASRNRTVVEANPAALAMIGTSYDAIVGKRWDDYLHRNGGDDGRSCAGREGARETEAFLQSASGEAIPILKTDACIRLGRHWHLLESFVDIRRLKEAEVALKKAHDELEVKVEERTRALKRSQAKLIQTEKIAALGTLTAGIAHELNNPMMGMLNFAQYCRKHVEDGRKIAPVLEDMEQETNRCVKIVQNLLTFSRFGGEDESPKTRIQPITIIERVKRLLDYRMQKMGVSFYLSPDEEGPEIEADVSNLQQVFLNLIGNALDAVAESSVKEIHVDLEVDGKWMQALVRDTGCGIPAERRHQIFDPFFTSKPVGKGTGLGLSVCRSIVEEHGGLIECHSREGRGATFVVKLPINGSI